MVDLLLDNNIKQLTVAIELGRVAHPIRSDNSDRVESALAALYGNRPDLPESRDVCGKTWT
jgi:hypothetical protein